jgi:hypothetical protein
VGVFERSTGYLIDCSKRQKGQLEVKDIGDFFKLLQEYELDAHGVVQGQNGYGKTIAALAINKSMGNFSFESGILYAYNTHKDAIEMLTHRMKEHLMFDELSHLFPYKMSMSMEQISLFSAIEVSRSHRNTLVGCCRDVLRINNNYRNGKAQILVWMLDRDEKGSFAAVLMGNPLFETEDKFMISNVTATYQLSDLCQQIEQLPTFIGYVFFDHYTKYISEGEWRIYQKHKEQGILSAGKLYKDRIDTKEALAKKMTGGGDSWTRKKSILDY